MKALLPDLVFGVVDNGLLVIGALIGADVGGIFGAVLGAALGNAVSDFIGGYCEGTVAEWLAKRGVEHRSTKWRSSFGKFAGCMICVPFALLVA
jgi:hypothetical protein